MAIKARGKTFLLTNDQYPWIKNPNFEITEQGFVHNFDPIPTGLHIIKLIPMLRKLADDLETIAKDHDIQKQS